MILPGMNPLFIAAGFAGLVNLKWELSPSLVAYGKAVRYEPNDVQQIMS